MYVNSTSCVGIYVVPDTTKQTTYIGKEANDKGTSFDDTAVVYSKSQMTTTDGTVSVKGVSSDATTSTYAVSSTATTSTTTDYLKSLGTPTVNEVQLQLTSMGYYSGAINGKTENKDFTEAVKKFQKDNNLDQTGIVNETTYNKIIGVGKTIQSELSQLGFYKGNIDGKLTRTDVKESIKYFQEVYGLSKSGTANALTRNKLKAANSEFRGCMTNSKLITWMMQKGLMKVGDSQSLTNFAQIWSFLKVGMGLGDRSASGVMGNIMQESQFSPTNAVESCYPGKDNPEYVYKTDDRIAYGIIQWCEASRKEGLAAKVAELNNEMKTFDVSVSDMNVQLAYFRKEMNTDCSKSWNTIKNSNDITTSTKVFCNEIEMPNASEAHLDLRLSYANEIYNIMA